MVFGSTSQNSSRRNRIGRGRFALSVRVAILPPVYHRADRSATDQSTKSVLARTVSAASLEECDICEEENNHRQAERDGDTRIEIGEVDVLHTVASIRNL